MKPAHASHEARHRRMLAVITITVFDDELVVTEIGKPASSHEGETDAVEEVAKRLHATAPRRKPATKGART